ncbi:hypothetical protein FQA39_LY09988 [Lamprigera yunnana]|nr:hypothetical protein FQA39_LY09988 [Lamprigera yunnana]
MCLLTGYGSISPKTTWGKLVTIIYAFIGIPLMLLYLSTTGDLLARNFRKLYGKLCKTPMKQQECPCSKTVQVPLIICLIIILGYICIGALLFNRLENWSILEGSYFCFTSLGTIGFGDLMPGQNAEDISLCASSAYILIGMALVAMCFSLVQDQVIGAEPLVEYFVPRSISDFDLAGAAGDTPISASLLPIVKTLRKLPTKTREKMVTFEDEMALKSKNPDLPDVFM